MDPIELARRRTTKFVLGTIATVWILSTIISSPPLVGWNEWPPAANWTIGNNLLNEWAIFLTKYCSERTLIIIISSAFYAFLFQILNVN